MHWTTKDVAKHYRVSQDSVRGWFRDGKGPKGFKSGRQILYPESEIRRYDAELGLVDEQPAGEWEDAVRVIAAVAHPMPVDVRERLARLIQLPVA